MPTILKTIKNNEAINDQFYESLLEELQKMIPDPIKKKISSPRIRRKMLETCGEKAFLMPDKLKFPVVDPDTCEYHCGMIYSAYIRAKQFKYTDVAAKARELFKDIACSRKVGVVLESSGEFMALEDFTYFFDE